MINCPAGHWMANRTLQPYETGLFLLLKTDPWFCRLAAIWRRDGDSSSRSPHDQSCFHLSIPVVGITLAGVLIIEMSSSGCKIIDHCWRSGLYSTKTAGRFAMARFRFRASSRFFAGNRSILPWCALLAATRINSLALHRYKRGFWSSLMYDKKS